MCRFIRSFVVLFLLLSYFDPIFFYLKSLFSLTFSHTAAGQPETHTLHILLLSDYILPSIAKSDSDTISHLVTFDITVK